MAKSLPEIIESLLEADKKSFCGLFWWGINPCWIAQSMFIQNDPNLQRYFGTWALEHFYKNLVRKQEHSKDSIIGVYPLEAVEGNLHLLRPENLREWVTRRGRINLPAALSGIAAPDGIPVTKQSKTTTGQGREVYSFKPLGSSRKQPPNLYLPADQVEYVEAICPLDKFNSITHNNDTHINFSVRDISAAIAFINTLEMKDYSATPAYWDGLCEVY